MATQEFLVERAKDMLRGDRRLREDAVKGVHVGNTAAGCLLAIQYAAPRWATESAVARALAALDIEAGWTDEIDEEEAQGGDEQAEGTGGAIII